nr:hypothetical protein [uncultured Blautia sp.]
MNNKMMKWLAVFAFCFLLLSGTGGRTVQAADNVIRDFSRIFYIPAGAVLRGTDMQGLREIYDNIGCTAYTESGEELYLNLIWDYTTVDVQTAGAYKIKGTVQLPDEYSSKVKLPEWTAGISVQNPGQLEIQVYSRMVSAGIYYFPWITDEDPDTITIWLKKEGEDWVNVSEEGYGFCDTDGMYLSCQSMVPGNVYTLTVTYKEGKTKNLTYRYRSDGVLDVLSYQQSALGGVLQKDMVIRSIESVDEKNLQRCMVYAVPVGHSLMKVRTSLEADFHIFGSTCESYEDTAAHPSVMMPSVWDFSQVNTAVSGVYKVTGTFAAPTGYQTEASIVIPKATAYITIQRPDKPEVQVCCSTGNTLYFPMVLDAFTDSQLSEFQIYIKDSEGEKKAKSEDFYVCRNGLYLKENCLKQEQEYGVCVTYPGGSTGMYMFQYGKELITNERWYERNYADRDGKKFPDIENGLEKVTDTSTIIVGNRLSDLMRTGVKEIPFEKNGVLVEMPMDVLKNWNVKEDDLLQVDISREDNEITIKIFKNGDEITDIPGATVEIPYTENDSQTVLTDEEGNAYTGTVNKIQSVAVIPIEKTGEYMVKEEPEEKSEEQSEDQSEEQSEEKEEQIEEKKQGEQAQEEHKKTSAIAGIIVIMLMLLWYLPTKKGGTLRKGDRSEGKQRR